MIRIRQIKCNVLEKEENIKKEISTKLHIKEDEITHFNIVKKSLDARKKPDLFYIYEVDVAVKKEKEILKKIHDDNVFASPIEKYQIPESGTEKLQNRIVIVGSGPAGLFATYLLAEAGYSPMLIERGEKTENRILKVETFWKTGKLDPNTNVQFGEGGAGTFSDGKLNTLVKDKLYRGKKVFETFVSCGAPAEIMYLNKPHIGTDLLRNVIINLRNKILELGGEIHYNSCLTNIIVNKNKLQKIEINNQERIACDCLILALGHSARDTFRMLYRNGLHIESKPFAIGLRIEHAQEMINESQYGKNYPKVLPPASYKLTYTTSKGRGVYSFCMCPGGYVVNASSEEKGLVINGMSEQKRDTKNANSAIIVTINQRDFGTEPLDGIKFQEKLEHQAYERTKGKIPVQLLKDFYLNKESQDFKGILPITKGETTFANLNSLLPEDVIEALKESLPHFNTKIKGFNKDDALLFGIETRTSSPIRMVRDENCMSNIRGIYVCGEGSGYAGGITTSAMDGLKCAEEIIKKYQKN